jgi:hypothetical protein
MKPYRKDHLGFGSSRVENEVFNYVGKMERFRQRVGVSKQSLEFCSCGDVLICDTILSILFIPTEIYTVTYQIFFRWSSSIKLREVTEFKSVVGVGDSSIAETRELPHRMSSASEFVLLRSCERSRIQADLESFAEVFTQKNYTHSTYT